MSVNVKRVFDFVVSIVGLVILLPVFCLIAFAILIAEGKPVLFRQIRVGAEGKDFKILKFRTMSVSASAGTGSFDLGSSLRVTGVGKILRRTKLDELPQLWNVLCGDMSLVGPRPEIRQWVSAYPDDWSYIHKIRPGITDPASIIYRNEEAILESADDPVSVYRDKILPQKLELYKRYVDEQSFWGDIVIMIKTLKSVVTK